jgi:hypothetical protein
MGFALMQNIFTQPTHGLTETMPPSGSGCPPFLIFLIGFFRLTVLQEKLAQ